MTEELLYLWFGMISRMTHTVKMNVAMKYGGIRGLWNTSEEQLRDELTQAQADGFLEYRDAGKVVAYAEEHDTDTAYVQSSIQPLDGEKEKNQTTAERSIYYNKDHQVVDDNNTFLYESEDGNRSLEIGVRTTESGIITEFEDDDLKTSEINNREVTIARLAAEDECYLAIFTKEGVTFTIQTKNLTEEELLMVLRELC